VADAGRAMAGPRVEPIEPDPACREAYDHAYARYRTLYERLRPLFADA
jgi:sugar (pentulose or hexulose) kinase